MKLGRFAILMIGITFCIGFLSWGLFYYKLPNDKEIELLKKNADDNKAQSDLMPKATARVKEAKHMVDIMAAKWVAYVSTRTPGPTLASGGIDLSVNAWQLTVDTPKFRDSIQRAINAQVKKGGIKVVNAPLVPPMDTTLPANAVLASFYNYPIIPFPVVIFDFGTITVQGTYKQIMDNVRAYKYMPHDSAVTDGLRIDGTSPNLTGTYNLSVVGFIQAKTIAHDVNEGASSGTGGGAGGAGGFGGPGMGMGGPPAGMGGPGRGGPPRGGKGGASLG